MGLGDDCGPNPEHTGTILLESHEAHPGMVVRIKDDNSRPEFKGMVGVIKHRFGHPDYAALDVRLEDGRLELFWHHQLEKVEDSTTAQLTVARTRYLSRK